MKSTSQYANLGKLTTIITFLIATIICALYLFTGDLSYGFVGYFFFLVAVTINTIILIILTVKASKVDQPKKIHRGIRLMLLNIPVAIFYFSLGIYFTGIMRICVENTTGTNIKNIKIIGCESQEFNTLKTGESRTVWININGDCSISLSYVTPNGKTQTESVISYVTSGMGQKFSYQIGHGESGW